jgi:hypothetical protein
VAAVLVSQVAVMVVVIQEHYLRILHQPILVSRAEQLAEATLLVVAVVVLVVLVAITQVQTAAQVAMD